MRVSTRSQLVARLTRATLGALVSLAALSASSDRSVAGDAFEAAIDRVWIRSDSLHVDFRIQGLLSERIRDGLGRGLPMTMNYDIALWRSRSGWWDALESRVVRRFKIQRNVWDDRYFVDNEAGGRLWLSDVDELEWHLCRRSAEFVTSIEDLNPDKSYYVVVSPSLRPLTIEDVREVEAWLTGEIEEGRERGGVLSVIASMPRVFFGVFVDLAGLGDKSTLARSGTFRIDGMAPTEASRQNAGDDAGAPASDEESRGEPAAPGSAPDGAQRMRTTRSAGGAPATPATRAK